jgi:hypothetical protein
MLFCGFNFKVPYLKIILEKFERSIIRRRTIMKYLGKTTVTCIALVLLVTFTFITCSHPLMGRLPDDAEIFVVEPGKGTPRFFHVDADNNPVLAEIPKNVADPGRTVMYVDDSPGAQGVYVVADSTGSANDVISILETNKDIKINFFYRKGEQFPHAIDFWQGGALSSARLSTYDEESETYAMTLEMDGEYEAFPNLVLNRRIIDAVNASTFVNPDLHDTQNARIRQVYISLGLYMSFGQIDGTANIVTKGFLGWLKKALCIAAIVCFAVAFVVAPPLGAALASTLGPTIITAMSIVTVTSWSLGTATLVAAALLPGEEPSAQPPSVTITANGVQIPENINHVYSLNDEGETVIFEIRFTNYPESSTPLIYLYNPLLSLWYRTNDEGATHFFEVHNKANQRLNGTLDTPRGPLTIARPIDKFTVYRNDNPGLVYDGKLDLVLYLGNENYVINGKPRPVTFNMPNAANNAYEPQPDAGNICVLHLKTIALP